MGCIVIAIVWRIAGVNAPIWYNATHYYANSSCNSLRLKNRRCDLTIKRPNNCLTLLKIRQSVHHTLYGSFTLSDTETDTDKMCTEPNVSLHGSLSLSSIDTSTLSHTRYCSSVPVSVSVRMTLATRGPVSFIFMQFSANILPNNTFSLPPLKWHSGSGKFWMLFPFKD